MLLLMDADGWYNSGAAPGQVMRETRCFRQSFYAVRRSRAAVYRKRISEGRGLTLATLLPPASRVTTEFTSQRSLPAVLSNASCFGLDSRDRGPSLDSSAAHRRDAQDAKRQAEAVSVPANRSQAHRLPLAPDTDIEGDLPTVIKGRGSVGSRGTVDSVSTEDPEATRSGFGHPGFCSHSGSNASSGFLRPYRAADFDVSSKTPFSEDPPRAEGSAGWKDTASAPASLGDCDFNADRGHQSDPEGKLSGFTPSCAVRVHETFDRRRFCGSASPQSSDADETDSLEDRLEHTRFRTRWQREASSPSAGLTRETEVRGKGQRRHTTTPIQDRLLQSAGGTLPPDFEFAGRRRQTLMRMSLEERLSFQTRWVFSRAPWVIPRRAPAFEE
ncbi:conserved hypothetical protein [Neospora caninum Liverpool]|uniref:Uncharacterized protein n=1 Tax=Neospora caninum (strain Liverpool) TaxID=572307 RepID=F0VDH8_NEOCL|nr:conserved hypothetical protein [Neospora caninum Liverpool]CBZ51771.1 conserved hypothetical protein [Neospora caninum Liverpool]CEL65728.1 TPA: hypothetical protein BN1204_015630 [Neospora caninum Liverpool]|eukprot:XP_003881804.1 conserved hypothetical protein [Neospora caninum Liverpool]